MTLDVLYVTFDGLYITLEFSKAPVACAQDSDDVCCRQSTAQGGAAIGHGERALYHIHSTALGMALHRYFFGIS